MNSNTNDSGIVIINKAKNYVFDTVVSYRYCDGSSIMIACRVKNGLKEYGPYQQCDLEIYSPVNEQRMLIISAGNKKDITRYIKQKLHSGGLYRFRNNKIEQCNKHYFEIYEHAHRMEQKDGKKPDIYAKKTHEKLYSAGAANKELIAFGTAHSISWIKLFSSNGYTQLYSVNDVEIKYPSDNPVLNYLQELSHAIAQDKADCKNDAVNSISVDERVEKQLKDITEINKGTVLYDYVTGMTAPECTEPSALIFPFETNYTQIQAIRGAFSNKVSIIQGPPGTGKTKTITNIIANIIASGKTVAIVSNNGKAVKNIYDKIASYGIGYMTMPLVESDATGTNQNKDIAEIAEERRKEAVKAPAVLETVPDEMIQRLQDNVNSIVSEIETAYQKKNEIQQLKQQLGNYKTEFEHYKLFYQNSERKDEDLSSVMEKAPQAVKPLMQLYMEFEACCSGFKLSVFIKKILIALKYKLGVRPVLRMNLYDVFSHIENRFYEAKVQELENAIEEAAQWLASCNLKEKENILYRDSQRILNTYIAKAYPNPGRDIEEYNKEKTMRDIIAHCPLVITTTFSIYNKSVRNDPSFLFDYLIMDEASQVNVLTGALALACTKHAVIVGDKKQLPPILASGCEIQGTNESLLKKYNLSDGYNYFTHKSILSSLQAAVADIKQTLLKEHYRCHPKIIGFCNQKFYDNELIIMTEDRGEENVLVIQETVAGNHADGHINVRQIEEGEKIRNLLLESKKYSENNIMTITPYRDQNAKIFEESKFKAMTVHKVQGQENKVIIMHTVDNVVTPFVADPQLMNVAISRATERLYVLVSADKRNLDTNVGDLIRYAQYNNTGKIKEGTIHSIFDLLYHDYAEERERLILRGRFPQKIDADSEKIFYHFLEDSILSQERFSHLRVVCHYQVRFLFGGSKLLSDSERKYINNPWTHVDFALFEKFGRTPVLCIEVDGSRYHRPGNWRDRMKNTVFEKHNLKLQRFNTKGNSDIQGILEEALVGALS